MHLDAVPPPQTEASPTSDGVARTSAIVKIVLIPGRVKVGDAIGHHDYLAGCRLLASLLEQTAGVETVVGRDGWLTDKATLEDASTAIFYTGGSSMRRVLESPARREQIQQLVDRRGGLVMIHQAVRVPPRLQDLATSWMGGVYVDGQSNRGHWPTRHNEFPDHPVTHGVEPWEIKDGWHNQLQFVHGMRGVTPLLWSSAQHHGSSEGGAADVVAWTYERSTGGRSFCFTGLDAHSAWSMVGIRQLMVNAILWSAGLTIPANGTPCAVSPTELGSFLTPRGWQTPHVLKRWGRRLLGR
ncbi:MAG: ThuA domain-containing protein [Nitrospirota bacterium]